MFDDIAKEIDDIVDKFGQDMDEVLFRVSRAVSDWMMRNNINTTTSLAFDKAFNDMLYEAGYYDVVNKFIDEDYDRLFPLIQSSIVASGIATTFNKSNLQNIMALKALDSSKFSILASTASSTLKESLTKYAISNYSEIDMMDSLQEELQGTTLYRHSKTIADSSISEFNQAVIDMRAADYKGDKVWWYAGHPIDEKTRDFCKCVLKKGAYYTADEANDIKRNSKRKYNCRHRLAFGTEIYAKEYKGLKQNKSKVCS